MIDECFGVIEPLLGTKAACAAVGRSRATHYRRQRPGRTTPRKPRPAPPNKLSEVEIVNRTGFDGDSVYWFPSPGRASCLPA